jgi:hypothetical protein
VKTSLGRYGLLLSAAVAGAGCFLTLDDILGKTCHTDSDCPSNYQCLPYLGDGGLTCSAIYPYQPDSGTPDSGTDAGLPTQTYYYCSDVKPILDNFCVSNCHGPPPGQNTSQQPFELDFYDGGVPGAFAEKDRIKVRSFDLQTMPPAGTSAPSAQQRQILAWWDEQGGPYCDGGTSGQVSFGVVIQPIFDSNCIGCHAGTTPAAGLDLSTGNSFGHLVNIPCGTGLDAGQSVCDGGFLRVKPSDTANSMLWLKTGNQAGLCGASMPKGQTPLATTSPGQYQQLTNWIQQGAQDN